MLSAERTRKQPVDSSNTMHLPQQFVMISRAYTDGVSLWKDEPQIKKEFSSECILKEQRSFRTAATFVPKLVAKHFVTTLTVADELTYYESIAFERRTVMTNFSETTNIFLPREITNKYCSSLLFHPDATSKYYRAGIELLPAHKCVVTQELSHAECSGEIAVNGEINGCAQQLINAAA